MQHNIVRKHRRTVSSINVGENTDTQHKATMSTFEDTQDHILTEISKDPPVDKSKHRLRHRAISDLIEACNKVPESKSVMVEELNVSISYKDPVFEFGKEKRLQELQEKRNAFKKSNTKALDAIAEKYDQPKSGRVFLRKKVPGQEPQKISLLSKKPAVSTMVNSISKTVHGIQPTSLLKAGTKIVEKI